jgi:hypothetical protein
VAEVTIERNRLATSDTAVEGSGAVTVGASSVEVAAANPDRVALIVCNDHASQVLYLGLGEDAVANQGVRINAVGGQHRLDYFTGAVNAIASGANTVLTFVEV